MAYQKARPSAERPAGRWGRFRSDHCDTLDDLLPAADVAFLRAADGGNICQQTRTNSKQQLAKKIALDFLQEVIDHIISTGDHYQLPAGSYSVLRVVAMPVHAGKRLLGQKRYRMNDVLATGGRFYQLRLELGYRGRRRVKGVYIDMARYHQICKLVALGKVRYDLA